nr:MAG: ORF1 [Anelloviridae sp.]
MAWGYRRRWRRRRRRRRPFYRRRRRIYRRRRQPYRLTARRRAIRFRRRGFRRRNWVRRRYPRKRQYKGPVTQWNPQHRTGCKIRGWDIGVLAISGHFGEKTEIFWQSSTKSDSYLTCGGGSSFKHYTLGIFYSQHLLFRNVWSTSNIGYDLARYFGTRVRFYPLEQIDYMVYWETSFEIPETDEMPNLAPGALVNSRHKKIIYSIKKRGRPKKVFIKPPPVHTNQWYFQKTWCNIPLFKIGIVPCNFKEPFLHRSWKYGVWIGYVSDTEPPTTVTWTRTDIEGSWPSPTPQSACDNNDDTPSSTRKPEGKFSGKEQWAKRVYYRWWWDDGVDNYIMMNPYNKDPVESGLNNCVIQKVNMPYWKFFFGLSKLTSKKGAPLCKVGRNPSIYALTWYADTECRQWPQTIADTKSYPPPQGIGVPYPDQDLCSPDQIPGKGRRKFWCILSQCWPWVNSAYHVNVDYHLPDYDEVRAQLTELVLSGPFAINYSDVKDTGNNNLNIGLTYTSYWQWGGFRPSPDTTEDPCKVGGPNPPFPGKIRGAIQIDDPADSKKVTIHPWDLVQNSIYTTQCFKRLLSDVCPELLTDPHRRSPEELQGKFRPNVAGLSPCEKSSSGEESTSSSEENSPWSEAEEEISGTALSPSSRLERNRLNEQRRQHRQHQPLRFHRVRKRLNKFLNEQDVARKRRRL